MKDECDINKLMGQYLKTGQIDHFAKYGAQYGDFSPVDLQEAMNTVIIAEQMFGELDSGIRKRFNNDPAEFLAFVQDEKNVEECRKLRLAKPVPPVPEGGVPPTPPT